MLKINSSIIKNTKRYYTKNTARARYHRNQELLTISTAGLCVQSFRFPNWEMVDIGITSLLGTFAIKSLKEIIKSRFELGPIIERAKQIKKASKI